jgi:hypothetical protein
VINQGWVDKESIERAIAWYIQKRFNAGGRFRFRWKKNHRKLFFQPL